MLHDMPNGLLENFELGMDRVVPRWVNHEAGAIINLGAGKKMIRYTDALDAPGWMAGDPIPYRDNFVDAILAYHFFEHLWKEEIIQVLLECQRVLRPGAPINIVVPHWDSEAAHQDLDHKSFFSESTWRNLFENPYYDGTMHRDWKLREHSTLIIGVVQRNLAVVTQLVKIDD